MKLLCVILPNFYWRCEIGRRPELDGRPVIVTRDAGSQQLVLDHAPEMDGLLPDMPLQQALARHGTAELVHADAPHYRTVFNSMLDSLEHISPLVEGPAPGEVYLGLDGLQFIYPDEDAVTSAVRDAIPPAFLPMLGFAGNKFLACLAARRCPPGGRRAVTGDVAGFLGDLPCDILPVSLKSRKRLREFGFRTLGQLAQLPPGPLQAQFGPEGKRMWELARGIDETPLYPRFLKETIEAGTTLASITVSIDAIVFALESILSGVFKKIGPAGLGINILYVWTRTWNAGNWERDIRFKEPAMDIDAAMRRVRRIIEDYPQPGPVEMVGVRIDRLGFPQGRQNSLFSDIRAREHLMNDIRQLELRLGNPQVYTVKEVEPWSRIPERRYALTPTGR